MSDYYGSGHGRRRVHNGREHGYGHGHGHGPTNRRAEEEQEQEQEQRHPYSRRHSSDRDQRQRQRQHQHQHQYRGINSSYGHSYEQDHKRPRRFESTAASHPYPHPHSQRAETKQKDTRKDRASNNVNIIGAYDFGNGNGNAESTNHNNHNNNMDTIHEEMEKRKHTLQRILEYTELKDRMEEFYKLTQPEQIMLFFKDKPYHSLPIIQIPLDWKQRCQQAVQQIMEEPEFRQHFPEGSDDDCYPGQEEPPDPGADFVRALPVCWPLLAGFLVNDLQTQAGMNAICYCPCQHKHMDAWQQFTGMDFHQHYSVSQQCTPNSPTVGKRPFSIFKHAETKQFERCYLHHIVKRFCVIVFQNHHGPGLPHIELTDNNTLKNKQVHSVISKKIQRQMKILELDNQRLQSLEKALQEKDEKLNQMKSINKELYEKVKMHEQMKQRFGSEQERKLTNLEEQALKPYLNHFVENQQREILQENIYEKFSIRVKADFQLNDIFQEWYDAYQMSTKYAFLFDKLDRSNEDTDPSIVQQQCRQQVVQTWNILIRAIDGKTLREIEKAINKKNAKDDTYKWGKEQHSQNSSDRIKLKAKDEGGPTRHFFSRFWTQLEHLKVTLPNDKGNIRLFEHGEDGLLPITDDIFQYGLRNIDDPKEQNQILEKIEAYYRAFGRMMAHAILSPPHTESNDPIMIDTHVLPTFYKNILIRGLEMSAYPIGSLIDHIGPILGIEKTSGANPDETYEDRVRNILSFDQDSKLFDFKQTIYKKYCGERSIFLRGISNGLSIGGCVDFVSSFQPMPTDGLTRLFFANQSIDLHTVFDEFQNFRFITFNHHKSSSSSKIHEDFQKGMADLFRRKMEESEDYVPNFVLFCTGSSYLPDIQLNPEWKIIVEFNNAEMGGTRGKLLPVVHTCDKTIKIPGGAYDADMDVFEAKLRISMDLSLKSFDMA